MRSVCPIEAPEVRQLEKNDYIVVTQPHVDRLRSNFTRWYSVAPWKLRNCQNPLKFEFQMMNDAQIVNIQTPISLERLKLQGANLASIDRPRGVEYKLSKSRSKGS